MTLKKLRIATRGSALALWQASYVKDRLTAASPETDVEVVVIKTSGDKIQDRALVEIGGKGLFVKEIQMALLDGKAELAVHSLKDYPVDNPAELILACIPQRQDPRDALVLRAGCAEEDLPASPRVGTGSLRRHFQLQIARPDWRIEGLRGNVDTRMGKVDSGDLDAVVLASAGLNRLGRADRISRLFSLDEMVPAVGQGAIAVEARKDSSELLKLLAAIQDTEARLAIDAERSFLTGLGGSCTTPLGIHAEIRGEKVIIRGFLSSVGGDRHIRHQIEGPAERATDLAGQLLEAFWERDAARILGRA
jgi:hydroxymethylbilane synthase